MLLGKYVIKENVNRYNWNVINSEQSSIKYSTAPWFWCLLLSIWALTNIYYGTQSSKKTKTTKRGKKENQLPSHIPRIDKHVASLHECVYVSLKLQTRWKLSHNLRRCRGRVSLFLVQVFALQQLNPWTCLPELLTFPLVTNNEGSII